ncbi:hypothetical protein [Xylanimonas ulmi]|uniref:Uncharacterized protein n=1 Tax=Xylanimonas ulmi TaxID=228973 RepID=A0A4Q7M3E5_9MICO|nr:hypothetical protein [Xylanibacterium ulmi]RZS62435.1 hypothetical protein EV386_2768 [Xylanibacterium ulmi]
MPSISPPWVVTTLAESISDWPRHLADLVDGEDVQRWQRVVATRYAPALIGDERDGQARPGGLRAVLAGDERVVASWPCFVDDDPLPLPAPAGVQVRANGAWSQGLMALTDRSLALTHETRAARCARFVWPRAQVRAVNRLRFALSMLSMTSSGDGYEVLLGANAQRVLFRVALGVRDLDVPALLRGVW